MSDQTLSHRVGAVLATLLVAGTGLWPATLHAGQPVTSAPAPTGESRRPRIGHLEVVAISEPRLSPRGDVEVLVTARDAHGLGAIEVQWGDESRRAEGEGRRFLTARLTFPEAPRGGAEIAATAVARNGKTRGESFHKVIVFTDDPVVLSPRAAEPSSAFLARLSDTSYPQRVEGVTVPSEIPTLGNDSRPWWTRWLEKYGPVPFDYAAACGEYVASQGITAFGEVLGCWLDLHPNVAEKIVWHDYVILDPAIAANPVFIGVENADFPVAKQTLPYASWTPDMKLKLYQAFYWAWTYLKSGATTFSGEYLPPAPANLVKLPPPYLVTLTVIAHDDAWKLYLGTIAHSLALEIGGFVPWKVVNYTDRDLEILFDSDSLLYAGEAEHNVGVPIEGYGYTVDNVVPAPPTTTFEFLLQNDIVRNNHHDTIGRFLTWGTRNLLHEPGFPPYCVNDLLCAELIWGYSGQAPAVKIMEGTTFANPNVPSVTYGPASWSPNGCHGMPEFTQHTLRALNIPVERGYLGGDGDNHGNPFFWTIGRTLSGGDSLFGVNMKWVGQEDYAHYNPPVPGEWLSISMTTYNDWFIGPDANPWNVNAHRQRDIEVPLLGLSTELLQRYCLDEASGASHQDGSVAAFFVRTIDLSEVPWWLGGGPGLSFTFVYYDVAQLEAKNLWTRLADKAQALGYCAP